MHSLHGCTIRGYINTFQMREEEGAGPRLSLSDEFVESELHVEQRRL